jgi:beta-N-acetylhexosaminidase
VAGCSVCGPLAPNYPAGGALGALWRNDHDAGHRAAWLVARLRLRPASLWHHRDCLPVLDVPIEGASDVIGARAYGKNLAPSRNWAARQRRASCPAACCR